MKSSGELPWWHATYDDTWSVAALLEQFAREYGERPALLDGSGEQFTHAQIAEQGRRVRTAIHQVASSDPRPIAVLTAHDRSSYVATYAVLTSGTPLAILEPQHPVPRSRSCIDHVGAGVVLTDTHTVDHACKVARDLPVVVVEEALRESPSEHPAGVAPSDVAALIFTSGSSGAPKVVARCQGDLVHSTYCISQMYRYMPHDIMLNPGSPGHVGTLNDVLCCMLSGFKSIPIDISRIDLTGIVDRMVRERVSILAMPPSLLRVFTGVAGDAAASLALRLVIASGEALLRSDVARFFDVLPPHVELWQNYGSTEAGPMRAGAYVASDAVGQGPLPLTRSHHGCTIDVVAEDGALVPAGDVGSIVVRSKYLAHGYVNASDRDAVRFGDDERGRFFRIGDRARISSDNALHLVGRGDGQISVHGRRVELGDVESAVLGHADVLEAVAMQIDVSPEHKRLVAVIRPETGQSIDIRALRAHLAEHLPAPAIPRRIHILSHMPRTASGKIDRARVADAVRDAKGSDPAGAGGQPVGMLENLLADCWQSVLDVARPGREDSFVELGGDSMSALELSVMVEERFGVRIPLDRIAELPTIAKQVGALVDGSAARQSVLVSLRDDGHGPLFVMLPGAGGHAWVYTDLVRLLQTQGLYVGVSIGRILSGLAGSLERRNLTQAVATSVVEAAGSRSVVLVGYSLGGLIACDVARELQTHGVPVEQTMLIDPTTSLRRRGPVRRSREARAHRRQQHDWSHLSAAGAALEQELQTVLSSLARMYHPSRIALVDGPVCALLANKNRKHPRGEVLRVVAESHVRGLDCSHLDLLRRPWVGETAAWMDESLTSDA